MPRFDYDPNFFTAPTGTWSPSQTVWGCKPPQIVLMEGLAFHDRRDEDTSNEHIDDPPDQPTSGKRTTPGKTTDNDPTKHDPDFDQQWRRKARCL